MQKQQSVERQKSCNRSSLLILLCNSITFLLSQAQGFELQWLCPVNFLLNRLGTSPSSEVSSQRLKLAKRFEVLSTTTHPKTFKFKPKGKEILSKTNVMLSRSTARDIPTPNKPWLSLIVRLEKIRHITYCHEQVLGLDLVSSPSRFPLDFNFGQV